MDAICTHLACTLSFSVHVQDCTKNRNEELSEAVPETLKNVLLVMAARGVLTRDWKVCARVLCHYRVALQSRCLC